MTTISRGVLRRMRCPVTPKPRVDVQIAAAALVQAAVEVGHELRQVADAAVEPWHSDLSAMCMPGQRQCDSAFGRLREDIRAVRQQQYRLVCRHACHGRAEIRHAGLAARPIAPVVVKADHVQRLTAYLDCGLLVTQNSKRSQSPERCLNVIGTGIVVVVTEDGDHPVGGAQPGQHGQEVFQVGRGRVGDVSADADKVGSQRVGTRDEALELCSRRDFVRYGCR